MEIKYIEAGNTGAFVSPSGKYSRNVLSNTGLTP